MKDENRLRQLLVPANMTDWDTLISYIQALPNNVQLSDDRKNVLIRGGDGGEPIILTVEEAHELILNAGNGTEPSAELISFLNTYLKENASDLHDEQAGLDLSARLSDKMSGLNSKVSIPDSLNRILTEGMNGTYKPDPTAENKHKISVDLNISKPDGTIYTATGSDMTKHIPYLKYNHAEQFSISFKMKEMNETVFDDEVTDIQALLALVVALKCQPLSWRRFIWDAWLAITIQWNLLKSDKEVFPCQWMTQIFYAESLVSLKDVKCLLLGQDPVSTPNETTDLTDLRKATGIAFHGIGNDNSSIEGMKNHYEIDCFDDGPIDLCKSGELLVNMIRTIGIKDWSVSNNSCRGAWIAYTLRLAHYLTKKGKPVIVFCKFPAALPAMYMPTACIDPNITLVPHPAYVDPEKDKEDIEKVKEIRSDL